MIATINKSAERTDLKPLGNVPVNELPPEFQDLLEASKPLGIEQFAPTIAPAPFWIIGFIVCAVFTFFFAGVVNRGVSAADVLPLMIVGVLLALFVGALWFLFALKSKYKRRVESGRLRLGVFLHPDALLIRRKENSCFLIPKNLLRGVIFERYTHAHYMYNSAGPRLRATKLIFVDSDGKKHLDIVGIEAFGLADRFEHYEDLISALHRWKPELEIVKL